MPVKLVKIYVSKSYNTKHKIAHSLKGKCEF